MNRYLAQLISDIHKARSMATPPTPIWEGADITDEGEIEDLAYAEEFVYGELEKIAVITGIATEMLPPHEKLNADQAALLARELEQLLLHYNFCPDFPENYPYHLRYPFIRNLWDSRHVPVSFGVVHIELCEYDLESCKFKGYCSTCEEMERESRAGPQVDGFDFTIDDLLPKI